MAYLILAILGTSISNYPGTKSKLGCCIITRGSYGRSGTNGNGDEKVLGDTSEEDLDDEEKGYIDGDNEFGLWSYEDTSAINWGATEIPDDNVVPLDSLRSNSTTAISDVCLNETDGTQDPINVLTNVTPAHIPIDSFVDEDESRRQKKEKSSRKERSTDKKVGASTNERDFLDSMCCGDPLELEKFMSTGNKGKSSKQKR